ncbi:MAG: hypothetical protein GY845_25590 [Planctomycetes bacterium]|nr:hypothetical protein [Planctomycetota bacterium]
MSSTPLYSTIDDLLTSIRMVNAAEAETLEVVYNAISDVRLEIFYAIGRTRALEIVGYTHEDDPITEEGELRGRAELLEIYWVRYKLIPILPAEFMSGPSRTDYRFNDEAMTREIEAVKELQESLWSNIQRLIGLLKDPVEVLSSFGVSCQGAETPYDVEANFIGLYRGTLDRDTHTSTIAASAGAVPSDSDNYVFIIAESSP